MIPGILYLGLALGAFALCLYMIATDWRDFE